MKWMSRDLFFCALSVGILACGYSHAQQPPPPPAVPPPATQQPPPVNPFGPPPVPALENYLAFDAEMKEVSVTNGTPAANFVFNLTNISSGDVIINFVQTSCGCTVAKLPSTPWKLTSKESGEISATIVERFREGLIQNRRRVTQLTRRLVAYCERGGAFTVAIVRQVQPRLGNAKRKH